MLPPWVRQRSSPATSIGAPVDSSSVVSRLRTWRSRSALIAGSVGLALDAAVVGAVVVGAVAVVLAVGLVVLVLVGDQVAQGEAVVRGDEVDRRERQPAVVAVEVRRAGEPVGEVADAAGAVRPEVAHGVAVLAVPLRPQRRELADLVAAVADVPRLGDQLDLRDQRDPGGSCRRTSDSLSTSCSDRASAEARSKRKPSTCISVTQ